MCIKSSLRIVILLSHGFHVFRGRSTTSWPAHWRAVVLLHQKHVQDFSPSMCEDELCRLRLSVSCSLQIQLLLILPSTCPLVRAKLTANLTKLPAWTYERSTHKKCCMPDKVIHCVACRQFCRCHKAEEGWVHGDGVAKPFCTTCQLAIAIVLHGGILLLHMD